MSTSANMKKEREWVREQSGGELAVTAAMVTVNFGEVRTMKFALTVVCPVQQTHRAGREEDGKAIY